MHDLDPAANAAATALSKSAPPASTAGGAGLVARALRLLVLAYRYLLKPWLGNACRFEPTCSAYALDALQQHGAAAGSYLTVARIVRCHPWCQGGCDPVPPVAPALFTRLFAKTRP